MKDDSVSVSKAIGIFLMVLCHTNFSKVFESFILIFHMPLFFFFSGYCFKEKYFDDAREFFIRKIKGIYIPFVKWSILFLLLHNVFLILGIYDSFYGYKGVEQNFYGLCDIIVRFVTIVLKQDGYEQLLGGFWFLATLFWGSIFSFLSMWSLKHFSSRFIEWTIVINVLLALGKVSIPFTIIGYKEFLAATFISIGFWYKKNRCFLELKYNLIPILFGIVFLAGCTLKCSMLSVSRLKTIPYVISALGGVVAVFSVSKLILLLKYKNLRRFLVYLGDNTLIVLTLHFLCFKIISLIIVCVEKLPLGRLAEFPVIDYFSIKGWWLLYVFVGIFVPLLIKYIWENVRNAT